MIFQAQRMHRGCYINCSLSFLDRQTSISIPFEVGAPNLLKETYVHTPQTPKLVRYSLKCDIL